MELNLDPNSDKLKVKVFSIKGANGFNILFKQKKGEPGVKLYQEIYGDELYIMKINREQIADIVYALEDFL